MPRDWAEYEFVRVYSSVTKDPKFRGIYNDDEAFAWYVRLLLIAKPAHPAPAMIPRGVSDDVLQRLASAEIITVEDNFFTVCGLAKEMEEVNDHRSGGIVRAATAERDSSGRFIAGAALPDVEADDGREDIEAWVAVRRRPPSPAQKRVLDDVLSRHDVTGAKWAAAIILANPDNPLGAVMEADKVWRAERMAGAKAEERQAATKRRGLTPEQQEMARLIYERHPERYPDEAPSDAA